MYKRLSIFLTCLLLLLTLGACAAAAQPVENPPVDQVEPTAVEPTALDAAAETAPESATAPEVDAVTPTSDTQPEPALSGPEPLTAGPVTLVTLGDSLTEGQGDSDSGGGYPARLLVQLQAARPGSQLVNVGHSGWSSDDLIQGNQDTPSELTQALTAVKKAAAAGQPALALVWIGSNDLWYLYEYGGHPITAETEAQDLAHYRNNLTQILAGLRQAGAQVLVALLDDQSLRPVVAAPPDPNSPAFTNITKDDLRQMSAQAKAYNAVIRAAAARNGAGIVDFFSTDIFTNPGTLNEDGNHPNPAGYDAVTAIWWQAIQSMLKP